MAAMGPTGLFAMITLVAAAPLTFAMQRTRRTAPVPADQQSPYQILPRTTPAAAKVLDRHPEAG